MKLSYIIVALAALAVANAGSVDLKVEGEKITITPKAPMKLVKKVAESGLGKCFSPCSSSSDCQNPQCDSCILSPAGKKYGNVCGNTCFSPCSSNSDCQDPQCDSCVLSPAGGNVCGSAPKVAESEGEKITITPKATPITAPLVKETVCHRILQTSIQTCIQEDDPTTCLLPGYGSGGCPAAGFPTCCHLATISTQWFQDPKCPIAFEPCPKNVKLVKKVAESGLGKCFSPCSSNSDCQDPQCDSCVLSPAGGNVCGIAPKVKNVAASIMKLVKKNAKFQK